MTTAQVYQLNIGRGGIPKHPVESVSLRTLGMKGDGHAKHTHGGRDKAVCIYALEAYVELEANPLVRVLPRVPGHKFNHNFADRIGGAARPGDFGENITTVGLDYATVRIGDVFQVGGARIQITMPRTPCTTVGDVFGADWHKLTFDDDVAKGKTESPKWGKSGFKARVVQEGTIKRLDEIIRV
jgi:MOSC domain-containing protein YiiM